MDIDTDTAGHPGIAVAATINLWSKIFSDCTDATGLCFARLGATVFLCSGYRVQLLAFHRNNHLLGAVRPNRKKSTNKLSAIQPLLNIGFIAKLLTSPLILSLKIQATILPKTKHMP